MRSSVFVVSSFVALALAAGCAVDPFASSPEAKDPGGPNVDGGAANRTDGGAQDADAAPPLPPGCNAKKLPAEDACVIDEAAGVFVSTSGTAAGEGTRAKPLANITDAIALAKSSNKRVYVCEGSYPESVVLANGVSMFGGFDCSSWKWNASGRAKIASPSSPAMRATSINLDTRVEGFDVVAPAGTANAPSSIGFIAATSPGVRFVHGSITAGAGFAGAAGTDAVQLANGAWIDGENNVPDGKCTGPLAPQCISWHVSRPGGTNTCVGKTGYVGGAGGDGGNGGEYQNYAVVVAPTRGLAAVATSTTNVGATVFDGMNAWSAALAGAAGASGVDGTTAGQGSFSVAGYGVSSGGVGTDGAPGQGGGGGSGQLGIFANGYYGAPGGGGGAGGCPGLAGAPGGSGGASVAVIAYDSAMTFDSVVLTTATGGAGGMAGLSSSPTQGGNGGADTSTHQVKTGFGGHGGAGGEAGVSGNGAGGPSVALARHGAAPTLSATTLTNGMGGAGVSARVFGTRTYPASPAGVSAPTLEF